MKARLFFIILILLAGVNLSAQNNSTIKGTIVDKELNDAIEGATVQLLSLPDSSFVKGTAADQQGKFSFENVAKARYTIKVSFIGYHTNCFNINLNEHKEKNVDLGKLALTDDTRMLSEALVTANAAKVMVSNDSLVFNASAYRVPEGSTLEALIKLLPGAQVDDDGKITINGKEVTKILLNGKEFFLNDMETAMKNIPTDMIEKIKSYERKSDMARITGIDDGEEETVLDLSVKKDMNSGWFEHQHKSQSVVQRKPWRRLGTSVQPQVQQPRPQPHLPCHGQLQRGRKSADFGCLYHLQFARHLQAEQPLLHHPFGQQLHCWTVSPDRNQDTYNYSYGGQLQWTSRWGMQIATDMRMNSRRGYSQANMNTDELLWNASISHAFLQGKALTIKAEMFDILHQQTNISRAVDAFSRRDSRTNAIYQYGLISLIYRFSVYGGKNTMGTDKERKELI